MVHQKLQYDVHFFVEDDAHGDADYQKILKSLPAGHFTEGSPVRDDLDLPPKKKTSPKKTEFQVLQEDGEDEASPEPTDQVLKAAPPKKASPSKESILLTKDTPPPQVGKSPVENNKTPSPNKDLQRLQADTDQANLTYQHRNRALFDGSPEPLESLAQSQPAASPVKSFVTVWNETLEARCINQNIGYGIFANQSSSGFIHTY